MIPQLSTETVVFILGAHGTCSVCGDPAEWFAIGVNGCKTRCGARDHDHVVAAEAALDVYRRDLARLSALRAQYAAENPVAGGRGGRRSTVAEFTSRTRQARPPAAPWVPPLPLREAV